MMKLIGTFLTISRSFILILFDTCLMKIKVKKEEKIVRKYKEKEALYLSF